MIGALIEAALIVAALVAAAVTFFGVVRPALASRHYRATLANIARLERELGFDVPLEARIDRELGFDVPLEARIDRELTGPSPTFWDYAEQRAGHPIDRAQPKPKRIRKGSLVTKWGERWP